MWNYAWNILKHNKHVTGQYIKVSTRRIKIAWHKLFRIKIYFWFASEYRNHYSKLIKFNSEFNFCFASRELIRLVERQPQFYWVMYKRYLFNHWIWIKTPSAQMISTFWSHYRYTTRALKIKPKIRSQTKYAQVCQELFITDDWVKKTFDAKLFFWNCFYL